MTEDSSLLFPYLREENRIQPKNSPINVLYQMLTHLEQQLGREAAGNTAPGLPIRPDLIRPMPIQGQSISPEFDSKMARMHPRTARTVRRRLLSERAAIDDHTPDGP